MIIDSPIEYEKAIQNVVYMKFEDTNIPVIGIKDLIKMKKKAGRKQDRIEIK